MYAIRSYYEGEKYIAETKQEYWQFLRKSMLGGALIAIFALLKIYMGTYELSPMAYAFIASLNYAICFILVKQIVITSYSIHYTKLYEWLFSC